MIMLGVGEIVGGQFIGIIRDKAGVKIALTIEILLVLIGVSLVLLLNGTNEYGILCFLMPLFWGI